jgi:EAL domain-containing protein (putative c-di-GMP-specific phosphodiesterase class I)/CHASE2 domain-containing sensor protein/GGDEF domain-containing protein
VRQLVRLAAVLAAMLALWGLAQGGMLASLDNRLGDWRLALNSAPVSGSTVVIEIDSQSLSEIGVWPWPRSLYARLLDQLMLAGADDVVFDIDFSSASDSFEDAIFTAALEQAGGYAWLAAFVQADASGSISFSRPLPQFAASADPVLVNVLLDPVTGRARSLPIAARDDFGTIEALAVQLTRPGMALPPVLEVDFALELNDIPRVSFTDVLYGRTDPGLLSGRQVIVGASAIELRDFFTVPRYGVIPGPLLQAMAVETLRTERILVRWGHLPGAIIAALLGIALLLLGRRVRLPALLATLLVVSALGEAGAVLGYRHLDIIIDTASLHIGIVLLLGLAVADNGYGHLLARRAAQERLNFLAGHDAATGLMSRQGLLDRPAPNTSLMLVLLQVQSLDELRTTLGYEIVEALLVHFAHGLGHTGFAELARIGPASFALIDLDHGNADQLAASARQLTATLSGTYNVDGHSLQVDVVAGYAAGSSIRADLLNQAEIALIQARSAHLPARGFRRSDQLAMERHRQLDRDLRQAVNRRHIHLAFQPQVDLKTRTICGAEALVRWDHPELGPIAPMEFIPLAEETGFIVELGRWILWEACRQATLWPRPITVAVNVSPIQFQHENFAATVESALRRSNLPASRLELELTETERVADLGNTGRVMDGLRALGVRLSMDDFGTGYSSLRYLRDLPFDMVKIDQSFVRDRHSRADVEFVSAIVDLSTRMGKQTVAEGIEDEITANRLAQIGCTYGQGYFFGRPMCCDDLVAMIVQDQRRAGGSQGQ